MPTADLNLFDRVIVQVEGVEFVSDAQRGFDAYSDLQLLAVRVKVTSQLESLRVRPGPDRFTLETDKRPSILAEPTCSKDPPLQKEYLKGGETVSGWVAFVVPRGLSRATLKSDLRKPFIGIPLSLPGSSAPSGGSSPAVGAPVPTEGPATAESGAEKPAVTERAGE